MPVFIYALHELFLSAMKKMPLSFSLQCLLFVLILLSSLTARAQIMVSATVGTTNAIYSNLGLAFNAINGGIHRGNITVLITGNTSEPSMAVLNGSGNGAASYSAVMIRPGPGSNPVVSGSMPGPLVTLKGVNNVTIDGSNSLTNTRNLTFSNSGPSGCNVLVLGSDGTTPISNVVVKNTTLVNGSQDVQSTALFISDAFNPGTPGYFNNILIENNSIQKAYVGIYVRGTVATGNGLNTVIRSNDLNSSGTDAIRYLGIFCMDITGATIIYNNIGNFQTNDGENDCGILVGKGVTSTYVTKNRITNLGYSGTGAYVPTGIRVSTDVTALFNDISFNTISGITSSGMGVVSGIRVDGNTYATRVYSNKISTITNSYAAGAGAAGILLESTATNAGTRVYNNFIWDVAAIGSAGSTKQDNAHGVVVDQGSGYQIDFNTIVLTPNNLTGPNNRSAALFITNNVSTPGAISLRNNILVNQYTAGWPTSRVAVLNLAGAGVFATVDYNDYYSGNNGDLVSDGSNTATALAQVQTMLGGNTHSKNALPVFMGPTDLHLTGNNSDLMDTGIPVTGIVEDIDFEGRVTPTPDIGADEFVCTHIRVVQNITVCYGDLPYTWNGQLFTTGGTGIGTYTTKSLRNPACDSTTTLNLTTSIQIYVVTNPPDRSIYVGDITFLNFTLAATQINSNYQWEVDKGAGFTPILNGDPNYSTPQTGYLTIRNTDVSMNGYLYRCVIKGDCGVPVVTGPAKLTVRKRTQTISFQTLAVSSPYIVTYGDVAPDAAATATSGLPVSYASSNTLAVTVGATGQLAFVGVGTAVISVSQAGNNIYYAAPTLQVTVIVKKKDLFVQADDQTRPYGESNKPLTMSWSGFVNGEDQSVLTIPSINTAVVTTTQAGTYPITLTGGSAANYNLVLKNGTFTVTGVVVNIDRQPAGQHVCEGTSVSFSTRATAANPLATVSYLWQQSSNSSNWQPIAGADAATYTVDASQTMYLRCEIKAPGTTLYSNTVNFTVDPTPKVKAAIAAVQDCANNNTRLLATGADAYVWTPATGLSNVTIANPVASPTLSVYYVVEGSTAIGCSAKDSVLVDMRIVTYPMANAFSPNGDGNNDCFGIRGWGLTMEAFEFTIFNRWGGKVFQSNQPGACWDGRVKGEPQPSGTFVYYIRAVTPCGVIERKGTVVLVR
jgi:gliding motility-associated-like protein